jgi:hypothetical protein
MTPDPRWLEILKASGWQILAGAASSLLLAGAAIAQAPMSVQPTETDLHAAYCTQVLKILIEQVESSQTFLSGPEYSTAPEPNDPPELRASKAKSEAATKK